MRKSFIAIPPGETIREQMSDKGINLNDFSADMNMSEEDTNKLLNGELKLTMDIARRLEKVLGPPAQFWCDLEKHYNNKSLR